MFEKPQQSSNENTPEITSESGELNNEAEKAYRKETRKILVKELSTTLKELGFQKTGHSLWTKEVGDLVEIIYLQRYSHSHEYFIHVGTCKRKPTER